MIAKVPLILDPQPEGGYTVTSPLLRGLVTEGDTIAEALYNAQDAFQVVLEFYQEDSRSLPLETFSENADEPLRTEILAPIPVRILTPEQENISDEVP